MKIVHISDTHGARQHCKIIVPECDVLIHTGDIGGRTNVRELNEFLIWFADQPATKKIFIAGNHDIVLDKNEAIKEKAKGNTYGWSLQLDDYKRAIDLIDSYSKDVKYLCSKEYVYEGIKFYGSPYSPSFHRQYWAFNADRGEEIKKEWSKIPNDVNVLMTHSSCYGVLDHLHKYAEHGEDPHAGCKDLLAVIKKRLFNLTLHASGHLHSNYGCILHPVSNKRNVLFSNGAVLTNQYEILIDKPLTINI